MIPTNGRTTTASSGKTGIPTTKWSLHAQWALALVFKQILRICLKLRHCPNIYDKRSSSRPKRRTALSSVAQWRDPRISPLPVLVSN
jgi:hypothetical protein